MTSKSYFLWFQAIILVVCLGLSYFSFHLVQTIAQSRTEQSFKVLTDQGLESIDRRFEGFARTLDGVAGLFLSSDLVTAEDMHAYAEALNVADGESGIEAIGFVKSTGVGALGAAQGSAAQGDSGFMVQYLEPKATDTTLLGYDFKADPQLLAAAVAARDTHSMLLTMDFNAPGALPDKRHGLLLKPIFRPAPKTDQPSAAPTVFLGFAFGLIDLDLAFHGLTSAQDELITLQVAGPHSDRLAAMTPQSGEAVQPGQSVLVQDLVLFGATLKLTWASTRQFESIQPFRVRWIVLAVGLVITSLITMIVHVLIRRNEAISRLMAKKSRDLDTRNTEQRSIVENAMLAIISATPTGEILHLNRAAQQMVAPEADMAALTGASLSTILPALSLDHADGRFKFATAPTGPGQTPAILEVEKNSWLTSEGEPRITLMLRDITLDEQHMQQIARTEQRWNLALQGAEIAVFDINLKRQTSVVSEMWLKILQIAPPPDCPHPYRAQLERMHPDDLVRLNQAEADCIAGKTDRVQARFRIRHGDDDWRWVQSDAVVVERAADGTALRMLGTQMDVTEQVRLDQFKRDFVATVSHELRTPLTSIKGAVGLLNFQLKAAKITTADRLIEIAQANSDRLASLVDDILDMEKINAGQMTHTSRVEPLNDILRAAAEQIGAYAAQWDVRLAVDFAEGDPRIWTDEKRAMQVLNNLLSNACKFAHTDSTVHLAAEILPKYARILVTNSGPGIPDEFRDKLFQPFSQADKSDTRLRGGTGLGLNISRQLIEAMGGQIGFTSEPGKETVFWFTCPLANSSETGPLR